MADDRKRKRHSKRDEREEAESNRKRDKSVKKPNDAHDDKRKQDKSAVKKKKGSRKKANDSSDDEEPESDPGTLRSYYVTQDKKGNLSCTCRQFRATGKACPKILAIQLHIQFGPSKNYEQAAPSKESRKKRTKGKKKKKKEGTDTDSGEDEPGPGKKRQERPIPDHQVNDELESFFASLANGWKPFDTDDEFDVSPEDESEPKCKKSKPNPSTPETKVSSGRPAASTPLHPNRTPGSAAHFSKQRGPKTGKGKNSLLPPISKDPEIPLLPSPQKKNSDGKPPAPSKKAEKIRTAFVEQSGLSAEELDMIDIDWQRWNDSGYSLRADEVDGIVDLLQALSLNVKSGILVLGPNYVEDSKRLRDADWLPTDDEPIDVSGAPLFPADSVFKRSWHHSQSDRLKGILIFHKHAERFHWLPSFIRLDKDEMPITCYESKNDHGKRRHATCTFHLSKLGSLVPVAVVPG
ncbi:hypothetical protein FB45DRAFT_498571 [Roridomyces roridus]|uniref:SWIM-type domain-containing protein n=1 Tax=Roridomyces roridus TaxID=1738132 RepID=A0AAD7BVS4_9AGAR|nr:hypothetical protein FB45DRAFT_498571 [Roridomyces roridus]